MTLKERMEQIKELETGIALSWEVQRAFGKPDLMGSQVTFGVGNDFLTKEELRQSVEALVQELGGRVVWAKSKGGKR